MYIYLCTFLCLVLCRVPLSIFTINKCTTRFLNQSWVGSGKNLKNKLCTNIFYDLTHIIRMLRLNTTLHV